MSWSRSKSATPQRMNQSQRSRWRSRSPPRERLMFGSEQVDGFAVLLALGPPRGDEFAAERPCRDA